MSRIEVELLCGLLRVFIIKTNRACVPLAIVHDYFADGAASAPLRTGPLIHDEAHRRLALAIRFSFESENLSL